MNTPVNLKLAKARNILASYKDGAKDKEEFEKHSKIVLEKANEYGLTHYYTALAVDDLVQMAQVSNGIYQKFFQVDTNVRIKDLFKMSFDLHGKEFVTTEDFKAREQEFKDMVEVFAPMDQFYFRSKASGEGRLVSKMLQEGRPFGELEVLEMCENNSDMYTRSKSWEKYFSGEYLKYGGWLITAELKENQYFYTVNAVGWDGVTVPHGRQDYETWKRGSS